MSFVDPAWQALQQGRILEAIYLLFGGVLGKGVFLGGLSAFLVANDDDASAYA